MRNDDGVFKALADPSRRVLLDALYSDDGQPLSALCGLLPDMTRFGVMKHLTVLEDAGLVVTERAGRQKLHYLNPVPIQQIYDRWLSRYAEPFSAALTSLEDLEEQP
jgi:DNA-binding transcriptional ArsR family regulator